MLVRTNDKHIQIQKGWPCHITGVEFVWKVIIQIGNKGAKFPFFLYKKFIMYLKCILTNNSHFKYDDFYQTDTQYKTLLKMKRFSVFT